MKIILNETSKEKGRSQYWLSQTTGIAASTINNLCNGKTTGIIYLMSCKKLVLLLNLA